MSRTGNRLLRQGDVLLIPVSGLPDEGWVAAEEETGERHVLAEGEATGHAHVLEGERITRVEMRRPRKWASALLRSYVVIDGAATLRHDEHLPISVATGVYEVRRQREYRPDRSSAVVD